MMPLTKPKPIKAFKFVSDCPQVVLGLGELEPGQVVSVEDAKRVFGEDFQGSLVLVPITDEPEQQPQQGGDK